MSSPPARPKRIGVLLNPHSGRVRNQVGRYRSQLDRLPAALTALVCNPDEIEAAIVAWALAADDLLVVIGGDGTLQAALTSLLDGLSDQLPKVLIVPAGTTNMSATAMGLKGRPFSIIKALARWLNQDTFAPRIAPRAVLQVTDSQASRAQCGLFFGAGSIVSGVRYFHSHIRPTGIKGVTGPLVAFVRMLMALFSRNSGHLLPAINARIGIAQTHSEANWLLVLATTLDKLLLGSTPFWGTEHAAMRLTAISLSPARLCRALPAVLRGRPTTAMRQDRAYLSHNAECAGIEHLHEYLLDGEIFAVSGKLEIKISPPVCFLIL
jgi:hypothetical protein